MTHDKFRYSYDGAPAVKMAWLEQYVCDWGREIDWRMVEHVAERCVRVDVEVDGDGALEFLRFFFSDAVSYDWDPDNQWDGNECEAMIALCEAAKRLRTETTTYTSDSITLIQPEDECPECDEPPLATGEGRVVYKCKNGHHWQVAP